MASPNPVQFQNCGKSTGGKNSKFVSKFKWSHPTWIDIPEFMKHVYSCPRGEQHRICKDIVIDYQKDWFDIILHNNNKSVNKLLDLFKMLNVQHNFSRVSRDHRDKKFSRDKDVLFAQAFEDLFSMPTTIKTTCNVFQDAGTKVTEFVESMVGSNLVTKLSDAADKVVDLSTMFESTLTRVLIGVQDKISNLKWAFSVIGSWIPQTVLFLAKICSMGYLLSIPANQTIKNAVAIVTLALPSTVGGNLEFISSLIRAIKGVTGHIFAQAGDNNESFITSFFTLTKNVMSGIFSDVDKQTFDDMHISSKKVRLVTEYIKSASTIVDFFMKLVEKLLEFISGKILKYYGVMPWFLKEDRLTPLIDRFIEIKEKRLELLSGTNRHAAIQVHQLYMDVIKMEASLVKSKSISKEYGIKIMPYLRVMSRTLEQVVSRIPVHLLSGKDVRRSKPFWVYIYGAPRIGKSAMFQPYLVNALAKALKLRTQYEDYTNYTYFRNCGDKYWEKYANHPVLWYNDLFQNYTNQTAMQEAIVELTNVVDDALYPLNMAFEEKHGVYFNSDVVISNSQQDIIGQSFIANECLSKGEHLYARRNIVVEFCLNPIYLNDVGTGIDYVKMGVAMQTKPCIGVNTPLFPKDMYIMIFHEPISGNVVETMDFENGMEYIINQAIMYAGSQCQFKERLYNHFKDLWAQAGDDDLPEYDTIICSHCNAEVKFDDYAIHEEHCRRQYVFCDLCKAKVRTDKLAFHSSGCAAMLYCPLVETEWYDACETVDPGIILKYFRNAVQKLAPELVDSPLITMVDQAHYNRDTQVMQALSTFYLSSDLDMHTQVAKIQVIIEVAGVRNWETYHDHVENRTLFKRLRNFASRGWVSFSTSIVDFVSNHPRLSIFVAYIAWVTLVTQFFSWFPSAVPKPYIIDQEAADAAKIAAQTAEGDKKGKTKQISRERKNKDNVAKAQSYDEQNVVVETKLRSHMCKFLLTVRNVEDTQDIDTRHFGSGLCVGSDVFVLPAHFWARWMEIKDFYGTHNNKVILKLCWDSDKIVEVPWDTIKIWKPDYVHTEDLVYIRISKILQMSHIGKFFVNSNDQPALFETYLYGIRQQDFTASTISVTNNEYATSVTYTHESRVEPIYNGTFADKVIHVPVCYRYSNCYTIGGDCGMLLMHTDSRMNCRKVLGLHTAGNTRTGLGISSAIFKEDIDEAFVELYRNEVPITLEESSLDICNEVTTQSDEYINLERTGVVVIGRKDFYDNADMGMHKKFKITLPRKSKIVHSIVYDSIEDDFGPTTVGPARLRPFKCGEDVVSPLYEGLKKIPVCSNMVSLEEIHQVTQHMYDSMLSWKSAYKEMFVLSDEQTINGYGLLKPIDMTTSAGFPYVVVNNTNGKHPYFRQIKDEPIQFGMRTFVKQNFESREQLAQQGIIKETFFLDTLKDEVRDLDKVASGKTRVFQIAPVDFNMLLRKYFGTFISFCHSTYLEGEMAVGINANSLEWTLMIKKLLENSDLFINGDGKNFDASLGQQYMMEVCEVVNNFYNDTEQNKIVRRVLFATFMNSRHIVGNLVYMSRQGNKSGIALTTIFNNLAGMFAIRLAFLRRYGDLFRFTSLISPKFYGDDDLISVKEQCLVDSCFYQQVWAYLGVKYTAADKSDVLQPYYPLELISFLQRSFVFCPQYNIFLPQLCFQTVIEIPRWSESDPYNMSDQMNRFNSALLECSNYGKEQFDKFRKCYISYVGFIQEMGLQVKATDLFTFQYAKKLVFPEIYAQKSLTNGQRDLLASIDKCEQLLLSGGGGSE